MFQLTALSHALLTDPCSLSAQHAGSDGWSRTDHLLALIVDELRLANWQRTGKRSNRPKRMSLLADQSPPPREQRPFDEVKAYLNQFAPPGSLDFDDV